MVLEMTTSPQKYPQTTTAKIPRINVLFELYPIPQLANVAF